jgi:hypothetical protein
VRVASLHCRRALAGEARKGDGGVGGAGAAGELRGGAAAEGLLGGANSAAGVARGAAAGARPDDRGEGGRHRRRRPRRPRQATLGVLPPRGTATSHCVSSASVHASRADCSALPCSVISSLPFMMPCVRAPIVVNQVERLDFEWSNQQKKSTVATI